MTEGRNAFAQRARHAKPVPILMPERRLTLYLRTARSFRKSGARSEASSTTVPRNWTTERHGVIRYAWEARRELRYCTCGAAHVFDYSALRVKMGWLMHSATCPIAAIESVNL